MLSADGKQAAGPETLHEIATLLASDVTSAPPALRQDNLAEPFRRSASTICMKNCGQSAIGQLQPLDERRVRIDWHRLVRLA